MEQYPCLKGIGSQPNAGYEDSPNLLVNVMGLGLVAPADWYAFL